jgi:hypothetical protein
MTKLVNWDALDGPIFVCDPSEATVGRHRGSPRYGHVRRVPFEVDILAAGRIEEHRAPRRRGLDRLPAVTQDVHVNRARVFEDALALPEEDRLKLAAELLASSPPPGVLQEGSPELAKAIEQRIQSVRRGRYPRVRRSRSHDASARDDDRLPLRGARRDRARSRLV